MFPILPSTNRDVSIDNLKMVNDIDELHISVSCG